MTSALSKFHVIVKEMTCWVFSVLIENKTAALNIVSTRLTMNNVIFQIKISSSLRSRQLSSGLVMSKFSRQEAYRSWCAVPR